MIPKAYQYLDGETIYVPAHVRFAAELIGTLETSGSKSNPVIVGWAKNLGLAPVYTADETPWCGLFVAHCIKLAKREPVANPLWAVNWAKFGIAPDPWTEVKLGDILVKRRKTKTGWAGHVAFIVGQDAKNWHILGGNQGDAVSIVKLSKSDKNIIAIRRPDYTNPDSIPNCPILSSKVGTNAGSEA